MACTDGYLTLGEPWVEVKLQCTTTRQAEQTAKCPWMQQHSVSPLYCVHMHGCYNLEAHADSVTVVWVCLHKGLGI